MHPDRIMIIRHGEKPPKPDGAAPDRPLDGPPYGVTSDGILGNDNLTPRGWQRAGALARFFAAPQAPVARPDALVAAGVGGPFTSLRAQQTIAPLAARLGLGVAVPGAPDDVDRAARAIADARGTVLVAWEHKAIARLVEALTGDPGLAPHWSRDRFDVVLLLDRAGAAWRLAQVPQLLLGEDRAEPLRARRPGETR